MNATPTQTNPQDLTRSLNRRPGWALGRSAALRPRIPGSPALSSAPVGTAAASGTKAAGAGTPRSLAPPALANRGPRATPVHWAASWIREQHPRSPGAPCSPLPPSRRGGPWNTYPHTAPGLRLLATVPRRPQRRAQDQEGPNAEERKNPPIQSGSLFILKLQPQSRTPPCS